MNSLINREKHLKSLRDAIKYIEDHVNDIETFVWAYEVVTDDGDHILVKADKVGSTTTSLGLCDILKEDIRNSIFKATIKE